MKDNLKLIFQVATVFIGTIVGAGLASGKEITQFFTQYGIKSFVGIIGCGIFYIIMGSIISKISIYHKLDSYSDVIDLISPNLIGKFTGFITTLFLISSASIILAGSGALSWKWCSYSTVFWNSKNYRLINNDMFCIIFSATWH